MLSVERASTNACNSKDLLLHSGRMPRSRVKVQAVLPTKCASRVSRHASILWHWRRWLDEPP